MNGNEWAERRKEQLRRLYGEKAEAWKNESDDRLLFSKMYRTMMEGLEYIKEDTPRFVIRATMEKIFAYRADMDDILDHFKDR